MIEQNQIIQKKNAFIFIPGNHNVYIFSVLECDRKNLANTKEKIPPQNAVICIVNFSADYLIRLLLTVTKQISSVKLSMHVNLS